MKRKRDYMIVFLMGVMGLSLVIGTSILITGCGKVRDEESAAEEKASIVDTGEQEEGIQYIPKEPPWHNVTYDGVDSITVYTGSAEWTVYNADGTSNEGIYCGVHPLEMNYDEETLSFDPSNKLHEPTLDFEVKPDTWDVMTFWPAEYMGNPDEYDNGMECSTTADMQAIAFKR